ncbi:MAG: imidazoleglycerol-phosphate dehydratase HisB [Firmicutes bacterium HGW-Firmicutes-11]|jgi:imidazoleglycerol-phosphate dehydratase|nr:MAG: imidazoleglycerol-phosphate dehydratase HisB [Firmicutes bacterium HGW-Firmicutes-11]
MKREAKIERKTKETNIELQLLLDGTGVSDIHTGIGFFDHMLASFAMHGGFDLSLRCDGDLAVDCHHTIEDVGIVLGTAFGDALRDKTGLQRYGSSFIPMDEALASCHVDLSGRPFLVCRSRFSTESVGGMDTCMVKEFFYAFSVNSKTTIHIELLYGENDHHSIEAMFKAFAHALRIAVKRSDTGVLLSTKGDLG